MTEGKEDTTMVERVARAKRELEKAKQTPEFWAWIRRTLEYRYGVALPPPSGDGG